MKQGLALAFAMTMVAAACGGSDSDGGSADATVASAPAATDAATPAATDTAGTDTAGTTTGGTDAAGTAAPAADCSIDDSPLIVGLYEVQGESNVGVNSFDFGSKLAIEDINAKGGVCGKDIKYDRTAPSISDVQVANAAFLAAVDKNPTAMIGLPAPNELAGLQAQIERAGIPTLATGGINDSAFFGKTGVSQYTWNLNGADPSNVKEIVRFAVEDLGLKNVAMMATTDLAPSTMDVAKGLVTDAGAKVTVALPYDPTTNDLTPQIIQVKGSDGLLHFCYPNTCAVQLNQFEQNGIDIPSITNSSLTYVANVLVKGPALKNAYTVFPGCLTSGDSDRPGVADFYTRYKAEFGEEPNAGALFTYNGVWMIKKAIEVAGSTDPEKVNAALATISMTPADGTICEANMHADGAHFMFHDIVVVKYAADGSAKEVSRVTSKDDVAAS